ncbi:PAS domain S-box protein [uncultured Hymenobacter sp.]|uniref:PAS domain S-box protein n=1 Tax=uncultured Hymenobacter sp. TaxID=170016 RepID=UPI0035CA0768
MPTSSVPLPLRSLPADNLLSDLLAVSLTGVIYYTPIYDPAGSGEIIDFTFNYLNPAAQRMMRMPEQPTLTHKQQWPHSQVHGTFAFHVDAYLTGEPRYYNINYQADGYDNYYRLAARRSGDGLLVSFTDTADQPRTPVEIALREAQAAEKAARAETEAQRQRLYNILEQFPAVVASYRGPEHVFELVSHRFQQDFPTRTIKGLPVRQALPELEGQQYFEILDGVYQTGEPFYGTELETWVDLTGTGQLELQYYNVFFQATRAANGHIDGILNFAYDVTSEVLARRQVQHLNQELEARVHARTQEAEQARAEAEQHRNRLERLFMAAPAAICIAAGPDLVLELVNPRFEELFERRSLLGKPFLEALPELDGHEGYQKMRRVYETGVTNEEFGLYVPIARLDGVLENRYFNYVQQARRDEQGRVDGVLVFAFEVTDQVRAWQKVEESSEELKHFKFMADQARDAFILMQEDGSFAYLNQQALAAWGYTEEEARYLRVPDVDPLHNQEGFAQLFEQAQHTTFPLLETRHRRKDGHEFPVEVGLAGLQLGGQPYLLAVARDITAQKQATEALRESEARFRIMADAAPNQVWAVNPDSTVRYVNRAFLTFVGVSLEDYLRVGWSSFMHPHELAVAQQTLEAAIQTRSMYTLEHRMRRHDGEYRWLLAQGAPSFFSNGELYGYVGAAIDITDLKQTNEQLVRTNVDLDNFIYTASHDLKAPISNIEGLLHTLQEELPRQSQTSEVSYILDLMQDSVDRFSRTIEHLTDVSKLQREYDQPSAVVSLAAVIEDVRLDMVPLLHQTGGCLRVNVQAGSTVHFSEKNLRSVVYNLLSNALKYHHPDRAPEVLITSQMESEFCVLEVQDNGLGMDLTRERDIFGLFSRYHTHVDGSGIGLYMVKRMVENAGGRIAVQSQVGQGSRFTVHLPR